MASQIGGRGGVSRVERKLNESLENGNYYEAHQMYRTLYSRYMVQNKHKEVQNLMKNGAFLFFSKDEHGSGVDLSLLLLEALETAKEPVTEDLIESIGKLHGKITSSHPQFGNFEVKAITWSCHSEGVPKTGHSRLRYLFAHNLWQEKSYSEARQHFLYANDGVGSAEMLVEFSIHHGLREEDELFITQFVLQLLCVQSKQTANIAFTTYTEKHPRCAKGPPYSFPLLNFVFFLLAAVETQKLVNFTALCEKYKPSLDRDTTYFKYLERIAENFFGVKLPKPKKGPSGLMGNLLQGLMGEESSEFDLNSLMSGEDSEPTGTSSVQMTMTEEDLD